MSLKPLLFVMIGGAFGSGLRYIVWLLLPLTRFPWATFMVNILGCFLIGFFMAKIENNTLPDYLRWFLITGFCGGFTTFSTFVVEQRDLIQNQQIGLFILYTAFSIIIGFALLYVGYRLGK